MRTQAAPLPTDPWERVNAGIGQRLHKSLFREVMRSHDLRPRLTLPGLLAGLLALIVDGLAVICLIGGAEILWRAGGWNLFADLAGICLLCFAILAFPRMQKVRGEIVPRERAPALYGLADRVAVALGAKPVDGIILGAHFNAFFTRSGWRRRRILGLGLPLLLLLNDQEWIALLGHELAHDVNGDLARSLLVGSAVSTLHRWYDAIHPSGIMSPSAAAGLRMMAVILGWPIWILIYVLSTLLWHESQRAEYLADSLAARVGGVRAVLSQLQKSRRFPEIGFLVNRAVLQSSRDERPDVLGDLESRFPRDPVPFSDRPEEEPAADELRRDATHPPLVYRLRFVGKLDFPYPVVSVTHYESQRLEEELQSFKPEINATLLDLYESQLYT